MQPNSLNWGNSAWLSKCKVTLGQQLLLRLVMTLILHKHVCVCVRVCVCVCRGRLCEDSILCSCAHRTCKRSRTVRSGNLFLDSFWQLVLEVNWIKITIFFLGHLNFPDSTVSTGPMKRGKNLTPPTAKTLGPSADSPSKASTKPAATPRQGRQGKKSRRKTWQY